MGFRNLAASLDIFFIVFLYLFIGVNKVTHHSKSHILGDTELQVKPYYPCLEKTAGNRSEIRCDPDVFDYLKENYESDLQTLLAENRTELSFDNDTSIATVSSSEKKKDSYHSWQEKTARLESFFQKFSKRSSPIIDSEIYDEVAERWEKQNSIQGHSNVQVSFDHNRRVALIVGESIYLEKEMTNLQELIDEIKEDTELMKSIVEVPYDGIPKSRLTLLQMSGICERLQSQHQHLSISFEKNGQRLCLKGPRNLLQEVGPELLAFTSKVIEQPVPFSSNIINVLRRSRVSDHIQSLLKQQKIQALFVYDESKTCNEVQVVGIDSKSVEEATKVLQNAVQERSLHLTNENAVVLESSRWKDFHSEMTSNFKVGIFTVSQSNTVCVSGIVEDVKECFEQVKHFLDVNTILHNSLPMDQGTTRFLVQKLGPKLDEIKKDLAACFLEMKTATNYDGIEVSGTAEGLEKCLPRLQELVKSVQKTTFPVENPGMKKFVLDGKGREVLKSIESNSECVILVKERQDNGALSKEADPGEFSKFGMPPKTEMFMRGDNAREGDKSPAIKGGNVRVHLPLEVKSILHTKVSSPAAFDRGASLSTRQTREASRSSPGIRITVKHADISKEQVKENICYISFSNF